MTAPDRRSQTTVHNLSNLKPTEEKKITKVLWDCVSQDKWFTVAQLSALGNDTCYFIYISMFYIYTTSCCLLVACVLPCLIFIGIGNSSVIGSRDLSASSTSSPAFQTWLNDCDLSACRFESLPSHTDRFLCRLVMLTSVYWSRLGPTVNCGGKINK